MNRYLQERVQKLFAQYQMVTLATCGRAGPQIQLIPYVLVETQMYLFIAQTSDHLFNLETQPELALLTPGWKLHGHGMICQNCKVTPPQNWQTVITVKPIRLHILSDDGHHIAETIDFG